MSELSVLMSGNSYTCSTCHGSREVMRGLQGGRMCPSCIGRGILPDRRTRNLVLAWGEHERRRLI